MQYIREIASPYRNNIDRTNNERVPFREQNIYMNAKPPQD